MVLPATFLLEAAYRQLLRLTGLLPTTHDNKPVTVLPRLPRRPSMDKDMPRRRFGALPPRASRDELEMTADPQQESLFFGQLPLELRRMIYIEVWTSHLSPEGITWPGRLKLHIHATEQRGRLSHTPCVAHALPAFSSQAFDAIAREISENAASAPSWFWWTWCLRLRWGEHCACQDRLMSLWDHKFADEEVLPQFPNKRLGYPRPPFIPMFRTCKKMYIESISTFFDSTTMSFENSGDISLFLAGSHRFAASLRCLELNFTYDKDQLFLFNIPPKHPRLACSSATMEAGMAVWDRLIFDLSQSVPDLCSLKVVIGGNKSADNERFFESFERVEWRPENLEIDFR